MFKKNASFTFEKLVFEDVLELTRNFVDTELSEVKEIGNNIYVKSGDIDEEKSPRRSYRNI